MSTICDDLRAAILQAAMQGRLTKQLPEDGNAKDLLEKIKTEKEKLISGGKIKKQKPLAPITDDEIPFSIPENWQWVRMADLFTIVTGKKDANFGSDSGEYRFFTCAKVPIYSNSYSFSGESILLAGNGDIGNISYYDGDFEAYQRTYVLQPFIEHTYAEYVLRHLMGNWVKYNKDKMFGTAIPYIRLSNVEEYAVAFPPLTEQKRIVEKVDELMARVADLEQSADALASLKKAFPDDIKASLLQAAMQGKLTKQLPEDGNAEELLEKIKVEKEKLIAEGKIKKQKPLAPITDDEIPFSIPNNWKWAYIPEACYFQEGPGILAKDFRKNGTPLIRIAGMQGNIVSLEGCNYLDPEMVKEKWSHFKLDEGDIVISTSASLDKIAEVDITSVGAIPYTGLIRFKMFDGISKDFFKYFIKSPFYASQIKEQEAGAAIKHYGPTHLNHMLMPIPPLAEQKRIVVRLNTLMQNINVVGDLIASE